MVFLLLKIAWLDRLQLFWSLKLFWVLSDHLLIKMGWELRNVNLLCHNVILLEHKSGLLVIEVVHKLGDFVDLLNFSWVLGRCLLFRV